MAGRRKICLVTGSRPDYGLLRELMDELLSLDTVQLQLLVTGSHLSQAHGLTIDAIRNDGYVVDWTVDMLFASDTPVAITKSLGMGLIGFADAFKVLEPDLVVVLGDRYEIWAAASACLIQRLPLVHIHGGEVTAGAFDEAIRHSITKIAHYHFTSTERYRQRVIQLGENPDRVFNVGSLGIDTIKRLELLPREALEKELDFQFGQRNLLVTFHPVTLDEQSGVEQFSELLRGLDAFPETHVIFTEANADSMGNQLNRMIADYRRAHPKRTVSFKYMGQLRYLSAMRIVDAVVGNSSSGVIEAPVLGTPTINVGERQSGRIKADSVIDCQPQCEAIVDALNTVFLGNRPLTADSESLPFGNGGAAAKMGRLLSELPLENILMKQFHDLVSMP